MVNNPTNINKTKESLNSDGQQSTKQSSITSQLNGQSKDHDI
jgi:hypothetical protein